MTSEDAAATRSRAGGTTMRRGTPIGRSTAVAGFTLLEALIALAIGGFGLIAVARLRLGLQGESDLAKQVSEATFLGQRRIEELRAYQQLASASAEQLAAGAWGYGNIATGSQSVTGTNATYTVSWTVNAAAASVPFKTAVVNVQWTDRSGDAQVATLATAISGTDPSASLGLAIPPSGTPIRRPKNRDLNVPVPAIDLGNGTSAFTPPGAPSTLRLVFSNTTGVVTRRCTGSSSDPSTWTCADVDAYLVTGYISVSSTNASLNSPIDVEFTLTQGTLDACYDDSALSTKTFAGFITYTCVILGHDHDGNPATRSRWSGRSDLVGITINATSSGNKICRYTKDYDASGSISNAEHPATYSAVTESLENQNFTIVKGNSSCPGPSSSLQATVQHQP